MDTCKMNLLKKNKIKSKKNPQPKNLKNAMYRWKEISLKQVIRGKKNKVKTGLELFTCWQGYSNKWRTDKILIIIP